VDARGDEYLAVFRHAPSALRAAMAAQRALAGHAWPGGARVSVRMGVHSGRPTLTDAGYVGLAVHAVNRICSLAEGGRIIVSAATVSAFGGEHVAAVLEPMGPQSLRGVREPVTLFRVGEAPG
jgi:class 3 adenylate cyclase